MPFRSAQGAAQAATACSADAAGYRARLADANINPATGLASDYLNHFNEAIMLLEMLPGCPECRDDFVSWRPMSYREHFLASNLAARDLAIAAYEEASPDVRDTLDALADAMTAVLETTRATLAEGLPPDMAGALAYRAAEQLKPLVARAGAVINGDTAIGSDNGTQATVDGLMQR